MQSSAGWICLRLADRTSSVLLCDRVQRILSSSASGMLTRYGGASCSPCTLHHCPERQGIANRQTLPQVNSPDYAHVIRRSMMVLTLSA